MSGIPNFFKQRVKSITINGYPIKIVAVVQNTQYIKFTNTQLKNSSSQ